MKEQTVKKIKQNETVQGKGKEGSGRKLRNRKLFNDKIVDSVWKIEVKLKGHRKTTWEPISSLKVDQSDMVKEYMKRIKNKTTGKIGATTA